MCSFGVSMRGGLLSFAEAGSLCLLLVSLDSVMMLASTKVDVTRNMVCVSSP